MLCYLKGYRLHSSMIIGFRHKGLKLLYEQGKVQRVSPRQVDKLRRILARLDVAMDPTDLDLPGFRLHQLKGALSGHWAVDVSRNWRVVFRFDGVHATDVDLVDYH